MDKNGILNDKRFAGMKAFEKKIWLASPLMHKDELFYVKEAIETNWARRDYNNAI